MPADAVTGYNIADGRWKGGDFGPLVNSIQYMPLHGGIPTS